MTILAFDMSSYLKTALLTGVDSKDGRMVVFEEKTVTVNSAEYGYEIVMNMMIKTLTDTGLQPIDCILVFEGMHSKSKRLLIDSQYKAKRDKRPPEFYEEFTRLRDYIETLWRGLGAMAMSVDYVEGDDVLAWLAREAEQNLIIASRDGDMGVLNTETGATNAYGATVTTYNDGLMGIVKMKDGPWVHPFKYIHLYKSLVGDTSDNIPGCKGFGPAAFQKLAEQYGYDGLDELIGCLNNGKLDPLHELIEDKKHKLVKMIVEQEQAVLKSYRVAKLYPEWCQTLKLHAVNTIRAGKSVQQPADADERIKHLYGLSYLVTAENYGEALQMFKEQAKISPELVFDIETSTPPESDDWLRAQGNPDGVDQIGSKLTGFSWTFGANLQHTYYVSVDHADTDNITMSQARRFMEAAFDTGLEIIIQNTMFELGVLNMAIDEHGTPWKDQWAVKYPAYRGFVPNALDTKIEANYCNENIPTGLKFRSKTHLGYDQQTFEQTTRLTGQIQDLPKGGRLISEDGSFQTRQYKMNELTADHVFGYGCDDTICTAALHRYYKLCMQLEHHYHVYLDVEIKAAYQHAKNFNDGINFSLEKSKELERIDDDTYDAAWGTVRSYLMDHGWAGTVPPVYGSDISAAQIKEAYAIVKGYVNDEGDEVESDFDGAESDEEIADESAGSESEEPKDAFLATRVRTPAKLVVLAREMGNEVFAQMLEQCLAGEHEKFTAWVNEHFSGEPLFKMGNKQMCHLLYDVMGLPVRVRKKPTAKMRAENKPGNPSADALAIEYALRDADEECSAVLQGLKLMQMVKTRRSLYYSKYPYFVHWLTGKIHPSHNQSHTNTRRASESKPNKQQLPKHPKISGQPARFREVIVPHHPEAVIVSMDFSAQELRVIADYSKDPNMVACYVGDNKRDMHSFIAVGIVQKRYPEKRHWTYEIFMSHLQNPDSPEFKFCKEMRALGKKVGFTTEYGAMAPKLAQTMLVTEGEAQSFIDAKEQAFPVSGQWKKSIIEEVKRKGFVRTKLGAVRHLQDALNGDDHWLKSKAERQAVNFKIQSSCAEMTKLAEGRMWEAGIFFDYDAVCVGPVHDEVVASVMVSDLVPFIGAMHACMVAPYADMEIPILSEISFGPSFYTQTEVGAVPDSESILKGLKTLAVI